jgi:hypothetical protein
VHQEFHGTRIFQDLSRQSGVGAGWGGPARSGRPHLSHRSHKSRTGAVVLTFSGRIRVCGSIWCIGVHQKLPQARNLPDLLWGRARVGGLSASWRAGCGWMWLGGLAWPGGTGCGTDRMAGRDGSRAGRERDGRGAGGTGWPGGTGGARDGPGGQAGRGGVRDGPGGQAGRGGAWDGPGAGRERGGAGRGGLADGGREVLGITGHSRVCAAGYRWGRVGLDIHDAEKSFHYDMAIRGGTSYRQVLGKERAGVRLTDRRKVG